MIDFVPASSGVRMINREGRIGGACLSESPVFVVVTSPDRVPRRVGTGEQVFFYDSVTSRSSKLISHKPEGRCFLVPLLPLLLLLLRFSGCLFLQFTFLPCKYIFLESRSPDVVEPHFMPKRLVLCCLSSCRYLQD